MAESNGDRDARLDRVERAQEEFRRDLQQLLTPQVIQKTQIDDLLKVTDKLAATAQAQSDQIGALNGRVDNLVSGIGEFIKRMDAGLPVKRGG